MLFDRDFPVKAGHFTVGDIENLEKALGFPHHCLVRNIPAGSFYDGFITLNTFYQLVDDRCFTHELHYVYDFHSSITNNGALTKVICALNYHHLTYDDVHLARVAFHVYEDPEDMKGLFVQMDHLLDALRMAERVISPAKLKRILHHARHSLLCEGRLQFAEFIQLLLRCKRYGEALAEYRKVIQTKVPAQPVESAVRDKRTRSFLTDKQMITGVAQEVIQCLPRSQLQLSELEHESLCQPTFEQLLNYLDELYFREEFAYRRAQTVCLGARVPPTEPLVYTEFRKRITRSARMQSKALTDSIFEARQTAKSAAKLTQIDSRIRMQSRLTRSAFPNQSTRTAASTRKLVSSVSFMDDRRQTQTKSAIQLPRSSTCMEEATNRMVNKPLVTALERSHTEQALNAIKIDTILLPERYEQRVLDDMEELRPGFKQRALDRRQAAAEQKRAEALKQLCEVRLYNEEPRVEIHFDRLVKPLTKQTGGIHDVTCEAARLSLATERTAVSVK